MPNNDNQQGKPVPLSHPNKMLIIEPLDYSNQYDHHQLHRHDYFEIILVNRGKGSQLIDFSNYEMTEGQIFTIYPGQVHLMKRNSAQGLLIQFRKDLFELIHSLKHYQLYFHSPSVQIDAANFGHLYDLTQRMRMLLEDERLPMVSIHKTYHYLQIILITLVECYDQKINFQAQHIVSEFLSLLTQHIHDKKKVADYCKMLNCSHHTLNSACKNGLGKPALEIIHEELLLEIRRLLLLNKLTLKEIAYELNFDSQANFSGFIKTKTGLSPSDLQQSLCKNL